tara:strand:+ start:385 stop:582 length:198 start_codon:yes stop_codon:yes gene_type:complete
LVFININRVGNFKDKLEAISSLENNSLPEIEMSCKLTFLKILKVNKVVNNKKVINKKDLLFFNIN